MESSIRRDLKEPTSSCIVTRKIINDAKECTEENARRSENKRNKLSCAVMQISCAKDIKGPSKGGLPFWTRPKHYAYQA